VLCVDCFFRIGFSLISATAILFPLFLISDFRFYFHRGHTSFVNCAIYTRDSSNTILTGSSDGTVKLWDLRSTECLVTYR